MGLAVWSLTFPSRNSILLVYPKLNRLKGVTTVTKLIKTDVQTRIYQIHSCIMQNLNFQYIFYKEIYFKSQIIIIKFACYLWDQRNGCSCHPAITWGTHLTAEMCLPRNWLLKSMRIRAPSLQDWGMPPTKSGKAEISFHVVCRESHSVCVMFKGELRGRKQTDQAEEVHETRSWNVENARRSDQGRAKN